MYSVTVNDELLYSPNLVSEGYSIVETSLTTELNKSGSFEFTVLPNNPTYDKIQKMSSIVRVFEDDTEIFRGRVLHDERDFYKRKKVYCEGELGFLIDSIVRPYDYTGDIPGFVNKFITEHNSQVDDYKKFNVGTVSVTDPNSYIHYSSEQYPNTWSEFNEKLIDTHGGYIRSRYENGLRYIDLNHSQ